MGSSMVVTGAELSLLQKEINEAISAIWKRLEKLEASLEKDVATPEKDDPDFDAVAEIPLKVDEKPAKKKTTSKKKPAEEADMAFEVN